MKYIFILISFSMFNFASADIKIKGANTTTISVFQDRQNECIAEFDEVLVKLNKANKAIVKTDKCEEKVKGQYQATIWVL